MLDNLTHVARDVSTGGLSDLETRRIAPDDREALARFFFQLSPESRYRRFLSIKPNLTPRELDWLTVIDHVTHEAIVAVDRRDGGIVGVCRYVLDREQPGCVELAIAVVDEWQGLGIGTGLAEEIVRRARDNEMTAVRAVTLARNPAVHALLRRLGFRRTEGRPGECEVNWELRLTGPRAGRADER